MIGKPATPEAYELMHRGALAFADVEAWGMRIDVEYVKRMMVKCKDRVRMLEDRIRNDDVYRLWQRRFGTKTNIGSRPQLGTVLYDDLKYEVRETTDKGNAKVDKSALEKIDLPIARWFSEAEQLKKMRNTYLRNILDETVDGLARPFFNLNNILTYRSSADRFSFQNLPIRDPKLGKIIRRAFIPRDGHCLLDLDYGQQEVRVAGCCCKDERLIYDTVHGDMHLDMAAECFMLDTDNVSKPSRQEVKSKFVFAQFYGDWYKTCAENIWESVVDLNNPLETKDGQSLKEHLESVGITELGECNPKKDAVEGTFEDHIREVEHQFWNERYKTYGQWRKDFYAKYLKHGWFRIKTGFVCKGNASKREAFVTKKQVNNTPIQGPAFHCLLWSLIRLVQYIKRKKMRSCVIGQIHDSMLIDAHVDELDELLVVAKKIMTVDIIEEWRWLVVPLVIEAEVAPEGATWYDKSDYPIPD